MLPSFCRDSIIRVRAGVKESRGSKIPDWESATRIVINNCSVQPATSSISMDGRVLGLIDSYNVFCNPGVDVLAGDHIIFEGQTFTVTEAPRNWKSATGIVSSVQFTMTLWRG